MNRHRRSRLPGLVIASTVLVISSACSQDKSADKPAPVGNSSQTALTKTAAKLLSRMPAELGENEGELRILTRSGYAESGKNDAAVNWVAPFEKLTGCKAEVTTASSADEAVRLVGAGAFDVVAASGDASLQLIAASEVLPVNTALLTNYDDLFDYLKVQPWNSVNGQMFGVPQGWGANLLQYRSDLVEPAPESWKSVFDPSSKFSGKITMLDSPMQIADAATYLMAARPKLGITNPYALDKTQFAATIELLEEQHPFVGSYWTRRQRQESGFADAKLVLGTSWQSMTTDLKAQEPAVPVEAIIPKEGTTGWSDTWMVTAAAQHPNCAYRWLDWMISADVNAEVAEWFGAAPANRNSCDLMANPEHCTTYHATDDTFVKSIHAWTTPIADCLDGRTAVKCTTYKDWTRAWEKLTR